MAQLTVRNVDEQVVRALKRRAADHGRSAEAEHREILKHVLLDKEVSREAFVDRVRRLQERIGRSEDSTPLIRADRDRDNEG